MSFILFVCVLFFIPSPICLSATHFNLFLSFSFFFIYNCSSAVCFLCTLSTAIALNKFRDSKISRIQPAPASDTENNHNYGHNIRYLHADQQLEKNHAHKFGDGKKKSLSNHDILKYVSDRIRNAELCLKLYVLSIQYKYSLHFMSTARPYTRTHTRMHASDQANNTNL